PAEAGWCVEAGVPADLGAFRVRAEVEVGAVVPQRQAPHQRVADASVGDDLDDLPPHHPASGPQQPDRADVVGPGRARPHELERVVPGPGRPARAIQQRREHRRRRGRDHLTDIDLLVAHRNLLDVVVSNCTTWYSYLTPERRRRRRYHVPAPTPGSACSPPPSTTRPIMASPTPDS